MRKDPPLKIPLTFGQLVEAAVKADVSKLPKSARPGTKKKKAAKRKK